MYFNSNIKFLRKRKGRTQDDVAFSLNMKRPTLGGYENQVAKPISEIVATISDKSEANYCNYFKKAFAPDVLEC